MHQSREAFEHILGLITFAGLLAYLVVVTVAEDTEAARDGRHALHDVRAFDAALLWIVCLFLELLDRFALALLIGCRGSRHICFRALTALLVSEGQGSCRLLARRLDDVFLPRLQQVHHQLGPKRLPYLDVHIVWVLN